MIDKAKVIIDLPLVQRLVREQFPQWAYLTIKPVESSGWDNRTFHLGDDTWDRGRGWVLWKTLCAPIAGTDCDKILNEIISDFNLVSGSKSHGN